MTLQNATNRNQTSVRQTVLSGSVDASGFPNALSAGSGLAVTLTATTTPFELTFAAGFNNGAIDYPGRFTANQSFSGLTASAANFLYVDRNSSTGALTTGFSLLVPAYARVAPASPVTDQHWFDLSAFTMKRWSGSAWVAFQRVFVGEAVTGVSTVTSIDNYAYRGLFETGWFAVNVGTSYAKKHYLGMSIAQASASVLFASSTSSTGATNSTIAPPNVVSGSNSYGWLPQSTLIDQRLGLGFTTGSAGTHYDNGAGSWVASAYYNLIFKRGW